jgi:hypothetical protein
MLALTIFQLSGLNGSEEHGKILVCFRIPPKKLFFVLIESEDRFNRLVSFGRMIQN